MINLSDDDANSTQLEGKKLKNRGARLKGGGKKSSWRESPQLDITKDGPALQEDLGQEEGQEFFIERELDGKETKKEREERLKREQNAARLQQQELAKQQQLQKDMPLQRDPNERLDAIEQGVQLSQTKGVPVKEVEFKQHDRDYTHLKHDIEHPPKEQPLKKTDMVAAEALLGDNAKNLDLSDDKKLSERSVHPTDLPDLRGKTPEIER